MLRIRPSLEDFLWIEKVNARALQPGQNGMNREEGVGEKSESLSLYKGRRGGVLPHLPGKIAYSPNSVINGTVGLPIPVLRRIP